MMTLCRPCDRSAHTVLSDDDHETEFLTVADFPVIERGWTGANLETHDPRTTIMSDVSDVLDSMFRFKPGDIVSHRTTLESWKVDAELSAGRDLRYGESLSAPAGVIVIARRLEQCHGGIQGFYTISPTKEGNALVAEHELVAYAELVDVQRARAKAMAEAEKARGPWRDKESSAAFVSDLATDLKR